jgi:hypothetical protein
MSKHTITGYLYHVQYDFQPDEQFAVVFNSSKTMGEHDPDWTFFREHSFEVELPDDFDPRPSKLAALEAQKARIRADFHSRIAEIDEQISKLQALTYSGSEA